ncbi:MAG: CpsD/CapB family tyrosine-protein kinase [Defluviitaleaceae bacterium]|nr:CpsD/CapB family tyrosine-protein kinase [Defluviitaleaceae bacterium]
MKTPRQFQSLLPDMPFQITEAYKTLRTNLMFSLSTKENKSVVVTSPLSAEGKSVTCANLAIAMAQTMENTNAKAILIDADLRKPTQYQIFKCNNVKGLSTVLGGFGDLAEVIKADIYPNLDVMTSGSVPPNPSELLGSDRMVDLLQCLSDRYEYIFIDTPPVNLVSDAMVLSGKTAGAVIIARHRESTYNELTKAISKLEFSGTNILGLVFNAVKENQNQGKYKYTKYYE